jgi:hypothetical protein
MPLYKQVGHLTRSFNGHTISLVGLFISLKGQTNLKKLIAHLKTLLLLIVSVASLVSITMLLAYALWHEFNNLFR